MRPTMEAISLFLILLETSLHFIVKARCVSFRGWLASILIFLSTVAAISFFPAADGLFSNTIYWRPYLYLSSGLYSLLMIHICTFLPGFDLHTDEVNFGGRTFVILLHTGLRFHLGYCGGHPSVPAIEWPPCILLQYITFERLRLYLATANWPLLDLIVILYWAHICIFLLLTDL